MQPLAGVELDDSSHNRKDRQDRDVFVEQAFSAAQLPLGRIREQRKNNPGASSPGRTIFTARLE